MNNEKKPAIRFKGFTNAWEQRRLGEICLSFEYGLNAAATFYDGKNKYLRITDIDDISHRFNYNDLTSPSTDITTAEKYKLSTRDLLFARTGASVGKTYLYRTFDGLVYYAGFLICAKIKQNYNAEFVFQNTLTDKYNQFIRITSQRSGQPGVNAQEYSNYEIFAPNEDEQRKIGIFLDTLDSLITLYKRKCEKLQNIKKSCLEKMFPKNGEVTPEIRFKGFTNAWEQRRLGDLVVSLQNNTLSRAELTIDNGVAFNIHYGDVLIKFGENLNVKKEAIPMIPSNSIVAKYKDSFLQNGDVIMTDTAEDETVGKCCEMTDLTDEIAISGLHTIPYRPLIKFASGYLGYYMNSASYHDQLLPLMQGIKVTSISKSAVQNTYICYPKIENEQAKISSFFRTLDSLITLYKRKCEKLQNIKKSCLEKMFPN